jgi:hypothetical protein
MSEATDAMDENDRERARLATLLARMEHGDFAQTVHEGWTVTAKLGHLAFWDRFALGLLERWAAGEQYETGTDDAWFDDTLNDALLAEWRALIPAVARQLVLAAAEAVDARGASRTVRRSGCWWIMTRRGCSGATVTGRSTSMRSRGRWPRCSQNCALLALPLTPPLPQGARRLGRRLTASRSGIRLFVLWRRQPPSSSSPPRPLSAVSSSYSYLPRRRCAHPAP